MSLTTSAIEQPTRRRGPGKPFPRGKSPNPGGRPGGRKYRALVDELIAEFGGDLPPTKRLLVEQLARLKLWAKVDDVRTTNAMLKITKALGIDRKREDAKPSLDDYARLHGDVP
jgi:hypothetical protein